MTGTGDSLDREIARRIRGVIQPDRIILFGEGETEDAAGDSNMDVLVVGSTVTNTPEERSRILDSLNGLGIEFGVFVISSERFEESKRVFGGIAHPANKYGRTIYEAV